MENIAEEIVRALTNRKERISVCESCTGGALSAAIVSVSGASKVYEEGYITYADRAKAKLLGVSETTLATHGAVSSQCAFEMAVGCQKIACCDAAISVTGFAGPDGGNYPVGTVFIGCAYKNTVNVNEYHFENLDRNGVREKAVIEALKLMKSTLKLN